MLADVVDEPRSTFWRRRLARISVSCNWIAIKVAVSQAGVAEVSELGDHGPAGEMSLNAVKSLTFYRLFYALQVCARTKSGQFKGTL